MWLNHPAENTGFFMPIPMISYAPASQNQRVASFEIPGEEQPRIFTTANQASAADLDTLIKAAYRQIFNEQQMLASNRQLVLESQLRSGQITVRDFVRGLATSEVFRLRNYETNSNYRFVQMCVQRVLGRNVYSEREKIAWSAVLMTKGVKGFIDELVNSEEYLSNFGEDVVPYQRRRILPQRAKGDLPFARMARYDAYYRDRQPQGKPYRSVARFNYSDADKFARFNLDQFLQQADWGTVTGLTVLLLLVLIAVLGLGTGISAAG
jgi:phycobilisome rod-core linker protein